MVGVYDCDWGCVIVVGVCDCGGGVYDCGWGV